MRQGWLCLLCSLAGAAPAAPADVPLARFEPATGCYIGAFIENDHHVWGDIERFEKMVGQRHASYFNYVGYGQPFPAAWVARVTQAGAAPHIAWEPNDGLHAVRDDDYLREWAYAARRARCPIFLRFASEMNGPWTAYHGDPELYIRKWRLVAGVMHEIAPNVAMVWAPLAVPVNNIDDYYPGDDVVDWVGVNIYSVHHHNGDPGQPADHEDPCELLDPIYGAHANRKPIMIAEYASTHFCQACRRSTLEFSIAKMRRLYQALPERYPRVKMINWFCWDTVLGGKAENNYSLLDSREKLSAYRKLTDSAYFLKAVPPELTEPHLAGLQLAQAPAAAFTSGSGTGGDTRLQGPATAPIAPAPPEAIVPRPPQESAFSGLPPTGQAVRRALRVRLRDPGLGTVKTVAFRVDGHLRLLTNQAPYEFTWDLRKEQPGPHQLEVIVYTADDRQRRFGPEEVLVGEGE